MNDIRRDLAPAITLGEADHAKLNSLALASLERLPDLADRLLEELERAKVVADAKVPEGIARMGSSVTYVTDADIETGRISVMTPIGTALIGLKTGQSITWRDRADKRHKLTVISVLTPQPA
jgi:regulator of nucleoside diphosphate kinase